MKTIQQLEKLLALAEKMGYEVRYENLGGVGGGRCEYGRRRFIFIDLSLNAVEQLEQVRTALAGDPSLPFSGPVANLDTTFDTTSNAVR